MTDTNRITTALLLAAGTGSRLRPLTENAPKCLTEVGGIPILGRLVDSLRAQKIKRLVVVIGHQRNRIREFLRHNARDMQVVTSPIPNTLLPIISIPSGWPGRR